MASNQDNVFNAQQQELINAAPEQALNPAQGAQVVQAAAQALNAAALNPAFALPPAAIAAGAAQNAVQEQNNLIARVPLVRSRAMNGSPENPQNIDSIRPAQSQLSQKAKQKILAKHAKADEKTVQELIKMGENPARIQEMIDAMAAMKVNKQESIKAQSGSKIENTQRADRGRETTTTAQNFTQPVTIENLRARYGRSVNSSTYDKLFKEILELTKDKVYENRCSFRIPFTYKGQRLSKEQVIEQIKIELESDWKISDEALKIFLEDFSKEYESLFKEERTFKTFSAHFVRVGPENGPYDWQIQFTTDWVQEIRVNPIQVGKENDLSLVYQINVPKASQRTSRVAFLGAHHYSHLNTKYWAVNTTYDYIKEVKPWDVMFLWYLAATDESIKTSTVDNRKRAFIRALEESYRAHNRDNNEDIDDCTPLSRTACAIGFKNKMAECFTDACNAHHPDNFYKADLADYFKVLVRASFLAVLQEREDLKELAEIWPKPEAELNEVQRSKIQHIMISSKEHAFKALEKNKISKANISRWKIEGIQGLSVGDNRAGTWEQIEKWVNDLVDAIPYMDFPSLDEIEAAKKLNKQKEEQERATALEAKQKAEALAERTQKHVSLLEMLKSISPENLWETPCTDLKTKSENSLVKLNITIALHALVLFPEDFIIREKDKAGITSIAFQKEASNFIALASELNKMNILNSYMNEGRSLLASYLQNPNAPEYHFFGFLKRKHGLPEETRDLLQNSFSRETLDLILSHLNIVEARNKDKLTSIDFESSLKKIQKTQEDFVLENKRELDRALEKERLAAEAKVRAEAEAKARAEAKAKAEAQAKALREAEEKRRKEEEARREREREAEKKRIQEIERRRREEEARKREEERRRKEEERKREEEARLARLRREESLRREEEQQLRELEAQLARLHQQSANTHKELYSQEAMLKTIELSETTASEAAKQAEAKARAEARRLREKREEEENLRLVAEAESKAEAEKKAKADAAAKANKAKEGVRLPVSSSLNVQFNAFINQRLQSLNAISNALHADEQPGSQNVEQPDAAPITPATAVKPSAKEEQPGLSQEKLRKIALAKKLERMKNPELFKETVEKTGKMYRFILAHPDYGTKQYKRQAIEDHLKSNTHLKAEDIDDVLLHKLMESQVQKEVQNYLDLLEAYPKTDTTINKLLHLAYKTVDAEYAQKRTVANKPDKSVENADAELARKLSEAAFSDVDLAEQARLLERFKPKAKQQYNW